MHLIKFKICVVAGNGSRVVVTHQIFYSCYRLKNCFSLERLLVLSDGVQILCDFPVLIFYASLTERCIIFLYTSVWISNLELIQWQNLPFIENCGLLIFLTKLNICFSSAIINWNLHSKYCCSDQDSKYVMIILWSKQLKDQTVWLLSSFVNNSSINEHKNMKSIYIILLRGSWFWLYFLSAVGNVRFVYTLGIHI